MSEELKIRAQSTIKITTGTVSLDIGFPKGPFKPLFEAMARLYIRFYGEDSARDTFDKVAEEEREEIT